jgi:hypothetical protein
MPCTRGGTPVTIVVCDGYVTVGITPRTRAYAPCATIARKVGTARPCASGSR